MLLIASVSRCWDALDGTRTATRPGGQRASPAALVEVLDAEHVLLAGPDGVADLEEARTRDKGEPGEGTCPRTGAATLQAEKEHRWLPELAPRLPLPVPVPLATGEPSEEHPWPWWVTPWLEGGPATVQRLTDEHEAAHDLAQFITALQRVDATAGPPPGEHNFGRGRPLPERDPATAALAALRGSLAERAVRRAWERRPGGTTVARPAGVTAR